MEISSVYNLIDFCKLNTPFLLSLILWDCLFWKQCQKSKFKSLDIYDAIFFLTFESLWQLWEISGKPYGFKKQYVAAFKFT